MKKPSPIKVRNPSENHLVPLIPNQSFVLIVPDNNPQLDFDEDYFTVASITKSKGNIIYEFKQKYDLTMWSRISRVFLGEVRIISEKLVGSLCVILTPKNTSRPHVISIINPYRSSIKVTPADTLEIVLYEQIRCGKKWSVTIFAGPRGLRYELIGYRPVDTLDAIQTPLVDDKELLAFPRSPLFELSNSDGFFPVREHHYWFRCDHQTLYELSNPRTGDNSTCALGKLVFDLDNEDYKILNIQIKNTRIKYVSHQNSDYQHYDYQENQSRASKNHLRLGYSKEPLYIPKETKYYAPYYHSGHNFKNDIDLEYKEEDNDLHSTNVMYVC